MMFPLSGTRCLKFFAPILFVALFLFVRATTADTMGLTFTDGVAAGEITPTSALLWTRTNHPVKLLVEISTGPGFHRHETRRRRLRLHEWRDNGGCFRIRNLAPATRYYYRFWCREPIAMSPVGTFTTAPAPDSPASLTFAYSGDFDGTRIEGVPVWNEFEILQKVLAEGPDFFVALGDTVVSDPTYGPSPALTFEDYCEVYRINRSYENLRALMAGTGTFWVSDDHEYQDNFAGLAPDVDADRFKAALKAFRVNNPVPKWSKKHGFYRTFRWGKHAEFFLLDERTRRSGNVTNDTYADPLPTVPGTVRQMAGLPEEVDLAVAAALVDPKRSILGEKQKKRFLKALRESDATWKFVVNEVAIAEQFFLPYDRWEGYVAERTEILEFIAENAIENVVFLTTDLHGNQVLDVRLSALAGTPVLAKEFICGPVADATIQMELNEAFGPEMAAQAIGLMEMLNPPEFANYDSLAYTVVHVDGATGNATFTIKNEKGETLYSTTLQP